LVNITILPIQDKIFSNFQSSFIYGKFPKNKVTEVPPYLDFLIKKHCKEINKEDEFSIEETQSDNEESENDTHSQFLDTFPLIVRQQLV
jgi:hypothetical protein